MASKDIEYLVNRGLMKPRYQQRSSKLRDFNNAMKVREKETGVKLTQPAKQVKSTGGQTTNKTQQRLKTRKILSEAFGKR